MAENTLRIGKVSSINYPDGTARITYEDKSGSTTAEMAFLAWEYWMPKVGDQVLVAHLSNGTCAGFILGPVWHGNWRPIEGFDGLFRKEFANRPGQATERYDAKANYYNLTITGEMEINASEKYTLTVGGSVIQMDIDGNITIVAAKSVTINSPETHIMGKLIVDKTEQVKQSLSVGGAATVYGKTNLKDDTTVHGKTTLKDDVTAETKVDATDDVTASGKSLKTHTHTSGGPGSPTSPPL